MIRGFRLVIQYISYSIELTSIINIVFFFSTNSHRIKMISMHPSQYRSQSRDTLNQHPRLGRPACDGLLCDFPQQRAFSTSRKYIHFLIATFPCPESHSGALVSMRLGVWCYRESAVRFHHSKTSDLTKAIQNSPNSTALFISNSFKSTNSTIRREFASVIYPWIRLCPEPC